MPLSRKLIDIIEGNITTSTTKPKHGAEIFDGTDYPSDWAGFIGQEKAKEQLQIQIGSAKARGVRIEHTLLASGLHGVGKSHLASLLAYQAGVGLVQSSGPITVDEARSLMANMKDCDIWFLDEVHMLVQGGKAKAEWLLPFMTEGKLLTGQGAEKMPNIAIVAATTDVGKLPQTLISRFMVQPTIVPYTEAEGALITASLAARMAVAGLTEDHNLQLARAADNNPRAMRQILTGVRDLFYAMPDGHPNLEKAFEWAGVSADGLTTVAREILVMLLLAADHTLSSESLRAQLNEPGPIKYHEQQLMQRTLISITGRGRKLTDLGVERAQSEIQRLRSA